MGEEYQLDAREKGAGRGFIQGRRKATELGEDQGGQKRRARGTAERRERRKRSLGT